MPLDRDRFFEPLMEQAGHAGAFREITSQRFVIKALPNNGARPRELARTMAPHPLSYQEFPYDPEYTLYNNRLTPEFLSNASDDEMYWKVRTEVIFRHTGELPIEISGPDAERLAEPGVHTRCFARSMSGGCSYQFACYHDGGMITDGVLLASCPEQVLDGAGRRRSVQLVQGPCSLGLDVRRFMIRRFGSARSRARALDVLEAVLDGPDARPVPLF